MKVGIQLLHSDCKNRDEDSIFNWVAKGYARSLITWDSLKIGATLKISCLEKKLKSAKTAKRGLGHSGKGEGRGQRLILSRLLEATDLQLGAGR